MDHFEDDVYLKTVQRLLQPQNDSIKHLFIMPYNLNLQRRPVCQNLEKVFDISSTKTWVATEVTLAILSAITVKRLAVKHEVKQKCLKIK